MLLASFAACGDSAGGGSTVGDDAGSDTVGGGDVDGIDTLSDVTPIEDAADGEDDGFDADDGVDDGADLGGDGGDAGCESFGCACDQNADCASGWCIRAGNGEDRVCTDFCVDTCPHEGFECLLIENLEGDGVMLCVPERDPLCERCVDQFDCGSVRHACLDLDDGRFCATACPTSGCPDGFSCETVDQDDSTLEVCVPDAGVCSPCFDADGDGYGAGEDCIDVDCNDRNGGVYPGAPEACNGVDDDCDTLVDEDFDVASDPNNCGACSIACSVDNGLPLCSDGVCRLGECEEGWGDCDGLYRTGCEADLTALDACGGCGPLPGVPGAVCGSCGTGTWTCVGTGEMACVGDAGADALNACGGCGGLAETLGESCGACDSGVWACDGADAVVCDGDVGEDAINACGGCTELTAEPGTACGTCTAGEWICDGTDDVSCVDEGGEAVLNACGGCDPLDGEPGDACGPCGIDRFLCDGEDALVCDGETFGNACGGCAALETPPGEVCGTCGRGTFVCDGLEGTICDDPDPVGTLCRTVRYARFGFPSADTSDDGLRLRAATTGPMMTISEDGANRLRAARFGTPAP